jgi:hypothetical protein
MTTIGTFTCRQDIDDRTKGAARSQSAGRHQRSDRRQALKFVFEKFPRKAFLAFCKLFRSAGEDKVPTFVSAVGT